MKTIFSRHLPFPSACALALPAMLAALPAHAAFSDWATSEGGRMRIVALPPDAEGQIRAGLQIEPKPGWITYWREPGDSGIPPQIAALPGSNATLDSVSYPVPKHINAGSVNDLGYDGPVTLPLRFTATEGAADVQIDVQAFIGVCRNICIPFQATFSLPLSPADSGKGQPHAEEGAILDAADKSLPEPPGDDFSVSAFSLTPDMGRLRLHLALPDDARSPEIVVTGPSGYVFTRQENVKPNAAGLSTDIVIRQLPRNYTPKGKQWRVLVKAGPRAMETGLAFD